MPTPVQQSAKNTTTTAAKKRSTAPENESPQDKLLRLANKRVNKALVQIRLIGNLGTYKPSQAEREAIVKAVEAEVAKMKLNVMSDSPVPVDGFNLAKAGK